MTYLTYGDVHRRANAQGLIMSRDRLTLRISLRRRDPMSGRQEWRNLSLQDALRVIESMEAMAPHASRIVRESPYFGPAARA